MSEEIKETPAGELTQGDFKIKKKLMKAVHQIDLYLSKKVVDRR